MCEIQFADGNEHRAVFELSVGEGRKAWAYLGGSVLVLVSAALVTGLVRKKQKRGRRRTP